MSTDRWAIQAGEPRNPEPDTYPPTVTLEEYLGDGPIERQPEDVDGDELAETIAVAGPEIRRIDTLSFGVRPGPNRTTDHHTYLPTNEHAIAD